MSEELLNETHVEEVEVSPYTEIARKYKAGESLDDAELDLVADTALTILRELLAPFDAGYSPIDEFDGDDGELILDVQDSNLAVLIGRHGRTLEALQYMFSLLVSRKLGFRYPVVIDIKGYKHRRKEKLIQMANNAAQKVLQSGRPYKLPPMSAYERRLIHIALRDTEGIFTISEGIDLDRRVVVKKS
ncbi:R3H domain-containing nucleic acid-binding protein [Collinsella sp. zg1085]|uniref:Jag family protein n=1 Tax=Collinsella sp. zg1085 TaxID=2844380 RepID=UPI00209B4072|nr:R3H domain-containing nucleic acid-binding protein [Collinsella sp. zg1085]